MVVPPCRLSFLFYFVSQVWNTNVAILVLLLNYKLLHKAELMIIGNKIRNGGGYRIETSPLICKANQSIDLQSKSMDWFLYDNGLRQGLKWFYRVKIETYLLFPKSYPKNLSRCFHFICSSLNFPSDNGWIILVQQNFKGTRKNAGSSV